MKTIEREQARRDSRETSRRMGVYRVRNRANGASLVGATRDLPAMLSRQRTQLVLGSHGCRELQDDWNSYGEEAFAFEVLEELRSGDATVGDRREDLRLLEQLWREHLVVAGVPIYRFRGVVR